MRERIDGLDGEGFARWPAYHLYTSEAPCLLGCSLHRLYVRRWH